MKIVAQIEIPNSLYGQSSFTYWVTNWLEQLTRVGLRILGFGRVNGSRSKFAVLSSSKTYHTSQSTQLNNIIITKHLITQLDVYRVSQCKTQF